MEPVRPARERRWRKHLRSQGRRLVRLNGTRRFDPNSEHYLGIHPSNTYVSFLATISWHRQLADLVVVLIAAIKRI